MCESKKPVCLIPKPKPQCNPEKPECEDESEEVDDLNKKLNETNDKLKNANAVIYQNADVMSRYQLEILSLIGYIKNIYDLPYCLPEPPFPAPRPECPTDSNEVLVIKDQNRELLSKLSVARRMYTELSINCNRQIYDYPSEAECNKYTSQWRIKHENCIQKCPPEELNCEEKLKEVNDQCEAEKAYLTSQLIEEINNRCDNPSESECINHTGPLQSALSQSRTSYQKCRKDIYVVEDKNKQCSVTVHNYNVSRINCEAALTKECPPKVCPKPQSPSDCFKTLELVVQMRNLCNRNLAELQKSYQGQQFKLEFMQGNLDFCEFNLNTKTTEFYDMELKYKNLWSSCTVGSQVTCESEGSCSNNSTGIIFSTLPELRSCELELLNLKAEAEKCEKNSQMANQFVMNMESE